MRTLLPFVFCCLFLTGLAAQTPLPENARIGTGRVSANINNKGALVTDFLVPNEDGDGNPLVSSLAGLSVWIGAVDPAGNLLLAIQRNDWVESHFQGGFRGAPSSGGAWKVTKAEIEQHTKDFEEDGDIDVIIPSIFSWPGWKSPYSLQWNGFSVDSSFSMFVLNAPFADKNNDGIYDPAQGDVPFPDYVVYNLDNTPTELVYVPFYTRESVSMRIDCKAVFFTYDCDDAGFLDNAIFGYITMTNTWHDRMDSLYLAFHVDGNIGQPADDYLGTDYNTVYFYNADSIDQSGFGKNPPVFGFYSFGNLLDTFGMGTDVSSIMPLYAPGPNLPAGMTEPQLPLEYYRYITGRWRDGSPLQFGGTGYQSGGQSTAYVFPGSPAEPDDWSERAENNPPGDRLALLSNGPAVLKPNATNRLLFALENVSGSDIGQQVDVLKSFRLTQYDFFYGDYFPPETSPYDTLLCFNTTAVKDAQTLPAVIFPNPANEQVTIRAAAPGLRQVALYDLLGRLVAERQHLPADSWEVIMPVGHLPAGLYVVAWAGDDGRRGSAKVAVRH